MYYENLTRKTRQVLEAMASFLGKIEVNKSEVNTIIKLINVIVNGDIWISYPIEFNVDQKRLECIEESPEGQFHRHHDAEKRPKFPYTLQQESILLGELLLLNSCSPSLS